jgi:hypothetical protein
LARPSKKFLALPALAVAGLLASLLPTGASSHREAPLISEDPVADATDLYAFVSPESPDRVNIIANYIPLEDGAGGPNFHKPGDDVRYTINIDNDGNAIADIIYEFRFFTQIGNPDTFLYNTGPVETLDDPDLNQRQVYTLARYDKFGPRKILAEALPVIPANIGPRSTPDYDFLAEGGVYDLQAEPGTKVFVGPRDDPFFVDLGSVFDLGGLRPLNEAHVIKKPTERGVDAVAGYNVHSMALQISKDQLHTGLERGPLTGPGDDRATIGIWTTAQRHKNRVLQGTNTDGKLTSSGEFVQVSRLGMPLVNEVVVPLGAKDRFNASSPDKDQQFAGKVQDPELAALIPNLYPGVDVPDAPRNDIVTIFLTGIPGLNQPPNVTPSEMLRLNIAVPPRSFGQESRLGVLGGDNAGFPNGRRLVDDVVDIELRALAGGTPFTPSHNKAPNNILGDGVDRNDLPFLNRFPYLHGPHQGYVHGHHRTGP